MIRNFSILGNFKILLNCHPGGLRNFQGGQERREGHRERQSGEEEPEIRAYSKCWDEIFWYTIETGDRFFKNVPGHFGQTSQAPKHPKVQNILEMSCPQPKCFEVVWNAPVVLWKSWNVQVNVPVIKLPSWFFKPGHLVKINRDIWPKRPGTFLKNRPQVRLQDGWGGYKMCFKSPGTDVGAAGFEEVSQDFWDTFYDFQDFILKN